MWETPTGDIAYWSWPCWGPPPRCATLCPYAEPAAAGWGAYAPLAEAGYHEPPGAS